MKRLLLFLLILMTACTKVEVNEKYCTSSSECACGTHKVSGDCFVGNTKFVNIKEQCPDFCSGIDGNMRTMCENNQCIQKYCGDCPQLSPPAPNWCENGVVMPQPEDECGCPQPPKCV